MTQQDWLISLGCVSLILAGEALAIWAAFGHF